MKIAFGTTFCPHHLLGNCSTDHPRVNVLGVGVSAINMSMALDFMEQSIAQDLRSYTS